MKQISVYAISTLVVGLIVAYFAFNLNREYVDLRYTLSEKIPTKFNEASTVETIQQLVVKNNGNISATQIQIKIDGFVKDYKVRKNLVSDVVKEQNLNGHFEAIYPSLPPGADFLYIFKTSGEGIKSNNIEIKHNKGNAKEALASDGQSIYGIIRYFIFYALIIFYLIMILFQFRSIAIDGLESRGAYTNYYDYLNKKKPIYVSREKWVSIRRKYIEGKIKPTSLDIINIEEEENYKILNQDKPNFLTEDEWELLKDKASKSLEDQLSYSIKTSSSFSNLQKYFLLKKPKHFPENKWQEIVKKINENFITVQKLRKKFHLSKDDILKELEFGIPSGMLPVFLDEYKKFLTECYYELVYTEILKYYNYNPLKYLKETNLSILNKKDQESLEDIAYKIQLLGIDDISSLYEAQEFLKKDKPEWIKYKDLEKLNKKAETYIALDKSIRKNKSLANALNSIVNLTPLKEKPDTLDNSEWDKVVELERAIATTSAEIEEDKANLESEKQKTDEIKDKILKQLSIIDDLLINPKSINKIESYENPFSEGNFANLEKLSKLAIELMKIK
ncbi:MAG: hypothetical protein ABSF79_01525 [Smithellaceae bacterium]|jgi:hypothetical protein